MRTKNAVHLPLIPICLQKSKFPTKTKTKQKKTSQYNEKPIEEKFNENECFPAVQFLKDSK